MSDFDVLLVGGGASAIFTLVQFTRELPSWRIGWVRDQPGRITHDCTGTEPLVMCLQGRKVVKTEHLIAIAPLALRHRLRRNPLDDTDSGQRVQRCLQEILGA